MISTKYGKMNVIAADQIVSHSLSLYGEWAGDELDFLSKLIKPGMNVLDVGAFIGTHTLAFAQFVGESGRVYSFEPRKEIYQVLCSNILANHLKHVTAFNKGLAETTGYIALEAIDITESVNFGGLSIDNLIPEKINNVYQVEISTVDSLGVSTVDFIKLDVEGMERRVLEGAIKVIEKDQPLIFCECNSLFSGYEIFEFCQSLNYRVFGMLSAAYNPNNFNGVSNNIFGSGKEVSLLLASTSSVQTLELEGFEDLIELRSLEDFVLPLLHKPQYAHEVLAHTNPAEKLGIYYPSPLAVQQNSDNEKALEEAEKSNAAIVKILWQRDAELVEKEDELKTLESQIYELSQRIDLLSVDVESRQQEIYSLHSDIQRLVTSTSWRMTKPLRRIGRALYKVRTLFSTLLSYGEKNPGLNGQIKLLKTIWNELRSGGLPSLKNKFQMFRQAENSPVEIANVVAKQQAGELEQLKSMLEHSELCIDTIIFDHNGGGGSNTYTAELISATIVADISILRVYCWDGDWYVQLRNSLSSDNSIYISSGLDELFGCLRHSNAKNIIINSLYGYKHIEEAIDLIIGLQRKLESSLDFKVHDFHSLCPSPHLSDYEQKYCAVPVDHNVCKQCLPRNLSWYHTWFDKSDLAVDIDVWRSPFQRLFDACSVITCFDSSSIDILRTDFSIDQEKIKVVPHASQYFRCAEKTHITSAVSIGVIGTLSHIKGGNVISELCSYIDQQKLHVPVNIIGESYTQLPPSAIIHGRYSPSELPSLIDSLGVSVVFMASIVPETFSYTISEAIEMGMPIVAFDIGAQGRRVREYRLGKVVPVGASPAEILAAVNSIHQAAKE
ncbi:FkbM family methyltransferase [Pseudomonas sp. B21-040]|uniref:FkbM family methyltransferase n=1 Tax=Pseudomonas sp. B21-040 TaxID=2895486 RepID=UPI00215EC590|nr:FkbM family methyltransferase [Pseudomonas sp. B21-040]UVL38917.1 FkbM family methyltransferase [Pseudomonas sp. B21-040]